MIKICEDYAFEFDIMFNPKKSKLMCYNMLSDTKPIIKLCNQLVQVVDSEVYLRSKIYNNVYKMSSDDIVCDFERRYVVHNFKMRDSQTLCRIFLRIAKVFMVVKYLITICHICLICMFRGEELFVIFLDCLRELIIL